MKFIYIILIILIGLTLSRKIKRRKFTSRKSDDELKEGFAMICFDHKDVVSSGVITDLSSDYPLDKAKICFKKEDLDKKEIKYTESEKNQAESLESSEEDTKLIKEEEKPKLEQLLKDNKVKESPEDLEKIEDPVARNTVKTLNMLSKDPAFANLYMENKDLAKQIATLVVKISETITNDLIKEHKDQSENSTENDNSSDQKEEDQSDSSTSNEEEETDDTSDSEKSIKRISKKIKKKVRVSSPQTKRLIGKVLRKFIKGKKQRKSVFKRISLSYRY